MSLEKLEINNDNIDDIRAQFNAEYDFDLLPELPELLSLNDLGIVFNISMPSAQKLIDTGILSPINIPGEAICFPKSEILDFIFANFLVNKPILSDQNQEANPEENNPEID